MIHRKFKVGDYYVEIYKPLFDFDGVPEGVQAAIYFKKFNISNLITRVEAMKLKSLFGEIRISIASHRDPNIKKVRDRMTGRRIIIDWSNTGIDSNDAADAFRYAMKGKWK